MDGNDHILGFSLQLNDDEDVHDPIFSFEKVVQWIQDAHDDRNWDEIFKQNQKLASLLSKLPCSSVTEDTDIMKKIRCLVGLSDVIQVMDINKLLNPTSVLRSYSDAFLQGAMASLVSTISDSNTLIVHDCPEAMPFLVACLRSPSIETRRSAAAALKELSLLDCNRRIIGGSGAIMPLIELMEEGDPVALLSAGKAILNLCSRVVENRERAVSDGAVIAVVDKIRDRVLVEEMLEVLEMLSCDENAIAVMEEKGVLQCLFMILRDDFRDKCREYCVSIIHRMCHPSAARVRRVDEVENGRRTLESVAITGTEEARRKATDLIWRWDLFDLCSNNRIG